MRYHGFFTRNYLVLENTQKEKNTSVLEIGVGTGSLVESMKGRFGRYHGVDIAGGMISELTSLYVNESRVRFTRADACDPGFSLGEVFDFIVSTDTFEHVNSPSNFMGFIKRHLSPDGAALLVYPNESEERHHGVNWMSGKSELLSVIDNSGLRVTRICEVRKSAWHAAIKYLFWVLPRKLFSKGDTNPQTFEGTKAFNICRAKGRGAKMLAIYSFVVTRAAAFFPLYSYRSVGEDIRNKILLVRMVNK